MPAAIEGIHFHHEHENSRWSRANLEKMATDLNNQNLQLKADLRLALDNHRKLLIQHNAHRPEVT